MEIELSKEKAQQKEQIKVTDKRIFTPEGEIREEFRQQIKPADPTVAKPAERTEPAHAEKPSKPQPPRADQGPPPGVGERRRAEERDSRGRYRRARPRQGALRRKRFCGVSPREPGRPEDCVDCLGSSQYALGYDDAVCG